MKGEVPLPGIFCFPLRLCKTFLWLYRVPPYFQVVPMAKRQKLIRDFYFAKTRETDSSTNDNIIFIHSPATKQIAPSQVELAQTLWKEQWATQFQWLDYSASEGKLFCKICREKGGRSVYTKDGSKIFKVGAFTDHYRSNKHQRLAWASTSGEKTMEKIISSGQRACDEALQILFKTTYFTGKQFLPYSKFPALCKLLMSVNAPITSRMYQDEKTCYDLIRCISIVIQKKIICWVPNSPLFGIMVDESTDISAIGHLVMLATIVEEGLPKTVFLGLLQLDGGKKNSASIFDCVISHLRLWDLDLCKFVAFGSDGASSMVDFQIGVSTRIRKEVNPFLLACHCVAHRTNLAALDAAKIPDCKVLSIEIDVLINSISSYFYKSSKCKHALTTLQE